MRVTEADIDWQKSSFSGNGPGNDCVEVATVGGSIRMREGDEAHVVVPATPAALAALLGRVKDAAFHVYT